MAYKSYYDWLLSPTMFFVKIVFGEDVTTIGG